MATSDLIAVAESDSNINKMWPVDWTYRITLFREHVQGLWKLGESHEPWFSLALFVIGSLGMIWRLGVMERKGLEGTVLGTLVMPYASGFSNLSFAYVLGSSGGDGILVLENCLVNNVTNLTLLIGMPAAIWALEVFPNRKNRNRPGAVLKTHRLNYLSLLLTLIAVMFFTGTLWALSRDGEIDSGDGLVLIGIFIFWQVFHLFDVLKQNIHQQRDLHYSMAIEAIVVIFSGWVVYEAIDRLVAWIPHNGSGFIVFENLGWLSGLLMVMPNAFSAFYYGHTRRADIVYSSQTGDGHICIPMCVGLFAWFRPIETPHFLNLGILMIMGAAALHFFFIAIRGKLSRSMGILLVLAYGFFIYRGILQ